MRKWEYEGVKFVEVDGIIYIEHAWVMETIDNIIKNLEGGENNESDKKS